MGKSRQASDRAWQATRKNLIINGDFSVWQRGTTGGSGFTADRWEQGGDGGGTFVITRQTMIPNGSELDDSSYYLRHNCTVAQVGGSYVGIFHKIEDVRTAAGKTVTISLWARGNAGGEALIVGMAQKFGSGGSPSSTVWYSNLINTTLTTDFVKYTTTVDLDDLSGKTVGTVGSSLELDILGDENTISQWDIAQVQVEIGGEATEFDKRSLAEELALCQRYFCKSYDLDVDPGTITDDGMTSNLASSTTAWHGIRFPVIMRAEPTITSYSNETGASGKFTAGVTDYTASITYTGHSGTLIYGSGVTADVGSRVHWTADAEL